MTARQLEDLHRASGANGHLTLPYRARLTPLAADFVRSRKLVLGYSDGEASPATALQKPTDGHPLAFPGSPQAATPVTPATASFLWWCDGPCGPAKAALTALAKEAPLHPLDITSDARHIAPVVKKLAVEVKAARLTGGILLVKSGASAMLYANRCPSLRAVLGTCIDSVDQGLSLIGANVLVIEHPYLTLQQTRNVAGRFLRGRHTLSDEARQLLAEVASCG